MKYLQLVGIFVILTILSSPGIAQRPELSISLNEAFFDSLLDAVFQNAGPIEFAIAENRDPRSVKSPAGNAFTSRSGAPCKEVIQLTRENNGVRTAVRFRDGKVLAPLAFSGSYNPPLIGCVGFSGYAETTIDLEFDPQSQRLNARARVLNVSLNGARGLGGSVIAKMVQSAIDRKVNPIEVLTLEKLSFLLPVRQGTNLKMKAATVRTEVINGALNVVIAYDFIKA